MLRSAEISVFDIAQRSPPSWKVVTFELCWPPFCRKKRFLATKIQPNWTSTCPKKTWKKGHTKQLRLSSAEISVFLVDKRSPPSMEGGDL